jgi:DNA-binding GntR family transcriptional regulator
MARASHPGSPRYQQLAEALLRDIEEGRYQVGAMLPPELELCEQHGVSRHTVREAIRRLADMGLLGRRQGVGTVVKARSGRGRFVATLGSIEDLFQYTQRTRLKLIDEHIVIADDRLAEMLHCRPQQRWLKLETCRYPRSDTVPISYTEIYIVPAYTAIRDEIEGEGVWVYGLVEKHYGERIVEVQQEVGTAATGPRIARLLHAKPRAPALHVTRYYYGRGERLLSVSVNLYPDNRFKFVTRWRLEWDQ